MATSTVDSRSPFRFPNVWVIVLGGFTVAIIAAGFWFDTVVHSALPQLDGNLTVAGLTAPVVVTRDSHGVPTIQAANLEDLFFAQGYVTAADRWFQMDSMRRFAAGELSQIVGEGN
jgi:penicillin G amidase